MRTTDGRLRVIDRSFDQMVRTVHGEAGAYSPGEMAAVAAVINNRSRTSGKSWERIVHAPYQFEPWRAKRKELEALTGDSKAYQRAAEAALPIVLGEAPDPTGGAIYFYAPEAQKALGRKPPSFDNGAGVRIGKSLFFPAEAGRQRAPAPPAGPVTPPRPAPAAELNLPQGYAGAFPQDVRAAPFDVQARFPFLKRR